MFIAFTPAMLPACLCTALWLTELAWSTIGKVLNSESTEHNYALAVQAYEHKLIEISVALSSHQLPAPCTMNLLCRKCKV